jgi:hypothetical protein
MTRLLRMLVSGFASAFPAVALYGLLLTVAAIGGSVLVETAQGLVELV